MAEETATKTEARTETETKRLFTSFKLSELGASLTEYCLLIALIGLISLGALRFLGKQVSTQYSNLAEANACTGGMGPCDEIQEWDP